MLPPWIWGRSRGTVAVGWLRFVGGNRAVVEPKVRVAHVLVGTGHHTKGSRTPSRLPAAVAEYLAHRRVRFWEPQAGMLEVDVASGDFFS